MADARQRTIIKARLDDWIHLSYWPSSIGVSQIQKLARAWAAWCIGTCRRDIESSWNRRRRCGVKSGNTSQRIHQIGWYASSFISFSDIQLTIALLRCHHESLSKYIEKILRIQVTSSSKSRWTIRNQKRDHRSRKLFILHRCIRDVAMDLVPREGNVRDVCYLCDAFCLQSLIHLKVENGPDLIRLARIKCRFHTG